MLVSWGYVGVMVCYPVLGEREDVQSAVVPCVRGRVR